MAHAGGAAPVGGAQPLLPMPAPVVHSYGDYLNDLRNNPYASLPDGYTAALAPFAIDTNNPNNNSTPAEVTNLVLSAQGAVPLLLMHGGLVHCYLQLSRFAPRLGLPATPWDNQLFATKGDLHNNQPITANWVANYFHQIAAAVTAPQVVTIQNAFAANPNATTLGPYNNGDPGTDVIRTRQTVFCPAPYAALILGEPVVPRVAFERIINQLTVDNTLVQCEPLVHWLRIAVLVNAAGESPLNLALVPTAPLADRLLIDHRNIVLHRDFPLLNPTTPQLQQHNIAVQLGTLVADNREHREAEIARKAADKIKLPSELFGTTGVATLCRYLRVGGEEAFPPLYQRLATASRHNRLLELQWAIDMERTRLGYSRLQFVITPAVMNKITSVNWIMDHVDNITSGLQPFLFGDTTPEESQRMSSLYQLVTAGMAAPNLLDAAQLMAPSKPTLPKHLFQTREMLQRMQIVLNVLLTAEHQMAVGLSNFLRDFIDRESMLFYYIPTTPGYDLCMPLLIVQWITLRIDHWFRNQAVTDAAMPTPYFNELFNDIDLGKHWEPRLSPFLLAEFLPPPIQRPNVNPPSRSPVPAPSPSAPAPSPSGGAPQLPNQMVRNPHYKEQLFRRYREMNVNHAALRARITTRPPPSPHGQTNEEMCLSYHIKGLCNMRCGRAIDHAAHTDAQDQVLVNWCIQHYQN